MLKIFNQATPQELEFEVDQWIKSSRLIEIEQMSYHVYTDSEKNEVYSLAIYYSEIIYDMS